MHWNANEMIQLDHVPTCTVANHVLCHVPGHVP